MKQRNQREKVLRETMPNASYEGDKAGLPTYLTMPSPHHHHLYPASEQKVIALETMRSMNHNPTELAATQSPSELGTAHWR